MKQVAVLRPEPGNSATAARIRAIGLSALQLPLFEVAPIAWEMPPTDGIDALLFTSANAVRHGGPMLRQLAALPVIAVGAATADAARRAGFHVKRTGDRDVEALLNDGPDEHLLWLSGVDRTGIAHPAVRQVVPVYRSHSHPIDRIALAGLSDSVALIHSARAGVRLAELVDQARIDRRTIRIAAISPKAADAAGGGWDRVAVAPSPKDAALIALARPLAIDP